MQSINQPAKFLIPFAQNDSAKVEIPATSSDPTRFSQSAGSPPLTGMPPEAGGVPPQLEDFNGAMNQIARGVWWALGGGRFPYDASWATDSLISGYARGAVLPSALGPGTVGMGEWYNNVEANTADPDVTGAGWVPGYHYGTLALTGQTGGTVTLTPAQAAKRVITVAGTLTSNLVLVLPTWIYNWTVHNNTGGAFTVTVKNVATPAVEIPQNGAPTPVTGDGSAVSLWSPNIPPAVFGSQPMQLSQGAGRLLRVTFFTRDAGGAQVISVNGGTPSTTGASQFVVHPAATRSVVYACGGGGAGGGAPVTNSSTIAVGSGGGAGSLAQAIYGVLNPQDVVVGTGGVGVAGGSGGSGGATLFGLAGGLITCPGGGGGVMGSCATTRAGFVTEQSVVSSLPFGVGLVYSGRGTLGTPGVMFGTSYNGSGGSHISGQGGSSPLGGGGGGNTYDGLGLPGTVPGAGGGGAAVGVSNIAARAGANGAPGYLIVYEYA